MRGLDLGIEADVGAGAAPHPRGVGELVVGLEGRVDREAEPGQVESQHVFVDAVGVEVDDRQHGVAKTGVAETGVAVVGRALRVGEDRVVAAGHEPDGCGARRRRGGGAGFRSRG